MDLYNKLKNKIMDQIKIYLIEIGEVIQVNPELLFETYL